LLLLGDLLLLLLLLGFVLLLHLLLRSVLLLEWSWLLLDSFIVGLLQKHISHHRSGTRSSMVNLLKGDSLLGSAFILLVS